LSQGILFDKITILNADPKPYNKVYWKCERTGNQTTPKCNCRAYSIDYYEPVTLSVNHNHEPMPEKVKCLDVIKKIKDTAARTS
jgi:hypothetical protein